MNRIFMGLISLLFGFSKPAFSDTTNFVILDVRTVEEYQDSHVVGSQNIDILDSNFKSKIDKLDKNKIYKLYCRSGNRSGQAAKMMSSMGFKDVENIGSLQQAIKRLQTKCEGKSC